MKMEVYCFSKQFIFVFLFVLNLIFTVSQGRYLTHSCINVTDGNYTSNSIYHRNLNTLLSSSLSSNVDKNGFHSASVGENSDRVNANVLCRGDVQLDLCRSCISNSTGDLLQRCPNFKAALIYYENCMVRYSGKPIMGIMSARPALYMWTTGNVTSEYQFNQTLTRLLESLSEKAASGGPLRKFATGDTRGPDFQNIYALVQCTPDLSKDQCSNCLQGASQGIARWLKGKGGGGILTPSCNFRYEPDRFFMDTDTSPSHTGKNNKTAKTVVIIVVTTISFLIRALCIFIFLWRRKLWRTRNQRLETVDGISAAESLQYDFDTIKDATNDFSNDNKLGQGGFGSVYRGKPPNGREIAVKGLSTVSGQGEAEFKNEVVLVAKLQHRNLVRLLGFCLEGTERLLVYEFVINSSLNNFIFDPVKREHLDWEKRNKIIGGIAKGLLYLHEDSRLRIIHRDLKASNVLLDAEMTPKIADFGMARLFVRDETQGSTSRIVGTYGYMAPEYVMNGHISNKLDVFSFGVLILEIVCGQKSNERLRNGEIRTEGLLNHAWKSWREGNPLNVIDPLLKKGSYQVSEIIRCIHIRLLCVQEHAANRPTMGSVVLMLSSSSLSLPRPSHPAFFIHNVSGSDMTDSTQSNDVSSKAEVSITELYPR